MAEAETTVAQARTRQELAEHACANLDSQLRDSHALREDLIQQRDRLQAMVDRQSGELETLQAEKTARLAASELERECTAAHIRAVEDRAHQEVDRARQDIKQWQQRHEAAERSHISLAKASPARKTKRTPRSAGSSKVAKARKLK